MKIAHLRGIPAPKPSTPATAEIADLGARLGKRNSGVTPTEQAQLDRGAADALGLDEVARARIRAWVEQMAG